VKFRVVDRVEDGLLLGADVGGEPLCGAVDLTWLTDQVEAAGCSAPLVTEPKLTRSHRCQAEALPNLTLLP
jgi:hypothetical protein